jgi:hypothetical protein
VKKARFAEQQIIEILKLGEAGTKVIDLCRKHGISPMDVLPGATSTAAWSKRGEAGANSRRRIGD